MVLGILWVFLSLGANVLRIYFVLKNDEEIFIKWKSVKLPLVKHVPCTVLYHTLRMVGLNN